MASNCQEAPCYPRCSVNQARTKAIRRKKKQSVNKVRTHVHVRVCKHVWVCTHARTGPCKVTIFNKHSTQYFINITLGTPKQTRTVTFDTGSAMFGVFCKARHVMPRLATPHLCHATPLARAHAYVLIHIYARAHPRTAALAPTSTPLHMCAPTCTRSGT